MYDITRKESFEQAKEYLETTILQNNYLDDPSYFLVGSKVDIANKEPSKRKVTYEEGVQYAN